MGNINYPSGNPFPYTSNSEESAYIDCLCYVASGSSISWSPSLPWTEANCTRHMRSGMHPFVTLRINAAAGNRLWCGLPGFKTPSSGGGSSLYAKFHWSPIHQVRYHSIPTHHYSKAMSQSGSLTLTSTSITSMHSYTTESSYFWKSTSGGKVLETKQWYLRLYQHTSYNIPLVYYSSNYPKPPTNLCSSTSTYQYHCRVYRSFNQRRYFVLT